jgi:small subunit ribosomal protein S20
VPSEKSARVSRRKAARNRAVRSAVHTLRHRAQQALHPGSAAEAAQATGRAIQALDRAARKGVLSPNRVARYKSQLMRALGAYRSKPSQPGA